MTSPDGEQHTIAEALDQISEEDTPGEQQRVLGQQLWRLRIRAGRPTYRAIGHYAGVSPTVTNCWLTGRSAPSNWGSLHEVIKFLGADPEEIIAFKRAYDKIDQTRASRRRASLHTTERGRDESPASAGPGSLLEGLGVVVGTAALLPFMQAIATQAGNRFFEGLRRRRLRRGRNRGMITPPTAIQSRALHVVENETGVTFDVPAGLPNEAIEGLTTANLEQLALPDPDGRKVTIWWNAAAGEWQRWVASP